MPARVAEAPIVYCPVCPGPQGFQPWDNVFGNNIASISRSVPNCSDGIFDLDHDPSGTGAAREWRSMMNEFIRRQNVERYHRLLETVIDETQREQILTLLAEEKQKQRDAGDTGSCSP